jgi:catalase
MKLTSAAIALTVAALLPAAATAQDVDGAALVDALHSAFGKRGVRAVHSKGLVLEGRFVPTAEAKALSFASLFAGPVPVIARFSDFTGIPDIPDTDGLANPRGLALKFRLPNGGETSIVTHSFNGFPAATSAEFAALLRTLKDSGADAPKPTPLDKFLDGHPAAKTFLTTQKPAPESYATLAYYGVNAFGFLDAAGHETAVRYRFVPKAGEHVLDAAALKAKGPNYLGEEIRSRVSAGSISFDWYAQIAAPGDDVANPSIAWPEDRKLVKLGTIEVTQMAADQAAADKEVFLPGRVPPGIEPLDPMILLRQQAYPISAAERGVPVGQETAMVQFRHELPNAPGRSLIAVVVDYPPGTKSSPHHHAPSAFIYAHVLSGAIRSQVDDGPAKVYLAGDSFYEMPGEHHRISENASATEPARLLAVFITDPRQPLTTPDAK